MSKTYIRLNHFTRDDKFKEIKREWEEQNPDTCLLPYTMKLERGKAKWECVAARVWRCSNCKTPFPMMTDFNYCPKCGAEMEGK